MAQPEPHWHLNYTFNNTAGTFDYTKWIQTWAGNHSFTVHQNSVSSAKKQYPTIQKQILGVLGNEMEITSAKTEGDTLYVQVKGPDKLVYNVQIDVYEDDK